LAEVYDVKSSEEELEEEEESAVEDDDLVGKALQKCAKISAELKRDLYGSGLTSCDRYAEVETSSVRIVTQVLFSFHFLKAEILFLSVISWFYVVVFFLQESSPRSFMILNSIQRVQIS